MKYFTTAIVAVALAAGLCAKADTREVVRIQYSDGIIDYIPASDIARISFTEGVDSQSELYSLVNTEFDRFKQILTIYPTNHFDIGYAGVMIGLDCMTEDMNVSASGYNWFSSWCEYHNRTAGTFPSSAYMWVMMYTTIENCNKIIADNQADSDDSRLLLAQAYALRSWAYWNLIQTYAPNYFYEPEAQGVVILPDRADRNGTYPSSTVSEVYTGIMTDINTAIDYLKATPLQPAHINVAAAKRYVDLGVAYGLRARYHLTMHLYAEAAADAALAIETSAARPLQPAAASYPGFNDAKLGNWMWAIDITADDPTSSSGVLNFTSHIGSLFASGYCSVGVGKACGKALHDYLESQPGDVRRMWFTDAEGHNINLTPMQQTIVSETFSVSEMPYLNVKFDNDQGMVLNDMAASDIPLMRIEEMYLIQAEGLAMSGNLNEGRNLLADFVATYRNPGYTCTAADAESLQKEIVWQRRAEFWGEGLTFFDKLRLQTLLERCDFYGFHRVALVACDELKKYSPGSGMARMKRRPDDESTLRQARRMLHGRHGRLMRRIIAWMWEIFMSDTKAGRRNACRRFIFPSAAELKAVYRSSSRWLLPLLHVAHTIPAALAVVAFSLYTRRSG